MRGILTTGGLVLVGMAALQQSHRRHRAEQPGEFADLRHIALAEKDRFGRIQTAGEEVEGEILTMLAEQPGIPDTGEGVIVRDEIVGFSLVLQLQSRLHHAEVVPKVEPAGGLESRKYAHGCH